MDLEVFSDPIWGIGKDAGLHASDSLLVARYDEEVVKPALLLADKVRLRTWRLDILWNQNNEGRKTLFPVPLGAIVFSLVSRDSQEAFAIYGIDSDLQQELQRVVALYGGTDGLPDRRLIESEAVQEFARRKAAYHRENISGLVSPALQSLVDSGVLEELPWDPRDASRRSIPEASIEFHSNAAAFGWAHMLESLDSGSQPIMFDAGIGERIPGPGQQAIEYPSANTLRNANDLMRMIDGLSDAPLDVVADLRTELADYLIPFRRFITRRASDVHIDPETPSGERQRQIGLIWESEVAPAVDDLRGRIQSRTFIRNVGRISMEGPEAAIGIGLGIAAAAASGAIGVTATAGLGVVALPTIVKAAASTLGARGDAKRDETYFVYEVERRLRHLATEGRA